MVSFCIAGEGVFQKDFKWFVRKFAGQMGADKVFVNDEKFNQEREKFMMGKMSAMQKDMNAGRSIDEFYQKQLQIRAGIIK